MTRNSVDSVTAQNVIRSTKSWRRSGGTHEFAKRIRSSRPEFRPHVGSLRRSLRHDAFPEFGLDVQQLWDRFEQIADTLQSYLRLLDDWDATLIRRAQR